MLLFHGTSMKRFKEILASGYIGTDSTIWTASDQNTTYFYNERFIREEYGTITREETKLSGISRALESAIFALAEMESNLKRVVLVLDSKDLNKIGKVEKDDSCGDNMDYCSKFSGPIPVSLIKEIWIDKDNLDMFRLYVIGVSYSRKEMATEYHLNLDLELDSAVLEASLKVQESLSEYFMENFENSEVLIKTDLETLRSA